MRWIWDPVESGEIRDKDVCLAVLGEYETKTAMRILRVHGGCV